MKKTALLFIFIVLLVTLSSCVTKRQNNSWHGYPPKPIYFQIGSVTVIIDHVREESISQQVLTIAETFIESQQKRYHRDDKIFLLNISIEQRSFMHNIEMYNSIFISINALDEEGNLHARTNESITGKKTFVSATEQSAIITRLLKQIFKEQQKHNITNQIQEGNTDS